MTSPQAPASRTRTIIVTAVLAAVVAGVLAIPFGDATIGSHFLASLRIARPKAVTAGAGFGNARQLQNVIAGILADTTIVAVDEPDAMVPTADSARRIAGFPIPAVLTRKDPASFETLGAHRAVLHINRGQLGTLLRQAGRPEHVDASLDGKTVSMTRPRGVRVRYGHCPEPVTATIQNQIQGPPPPSTDNGNCVILTALPLALFELPPALDTASVMEIALELSGMSPNQAGKFRELFDWRAALSLMTPRGMRSFEMKTVAGANAMLMISAGRREVAYTLAWTRDGIVYTLAGYGSSGDAVPLAESVH